MIARMVALTPIMVMVAKRTAVTSLPAFLMMRLLKVVTQSLILLVIMSVYSSSTGNMM